MSGIDWTALDHGLFVHLPIAAAILLPAALIAAQRPGRGIKPWWTTCRYLAWAGVVGAGLAVLSGFWTAHASHLLPAGEWIAKGSIRNPSLFQVHQWTGLTSLVLGALTIRSLHRKRQDHQGIGILGLFLGLLWAGAVLAAGYMGHLLGRQAPGNPLAPPAKPVAVQVKDPEKAAPLRAMAYGSLVPLRPAPVESVPRGNCWIRVWVSPSAEDACREGRQLPEGSMVGRTRLTFHWSETMRVEKMAT